MAENGKRNDLGKKVRMWLPLILVLSTIISGGVALQVKSQNNEEAIGETKVEVKEQRKENERQNGNIIELKQDVKYMREDIKEMRIEQKEQKSLLIQILNKVQ